MNWKDYKGHSDEKYQRYLCSREWSVLKRAVKKRCNNICEKCHRGEVENIHHLTYKRRYRERLNDLQGVCFRCHKFEHALEETYDALYEPLPEPIIPPAALCAICERKGDLVGRTGDKHYCEPCSIKLDDKRRGSDEQTIISSPRVGRQFREGRLQKMRNDAVGSLSEQARRQGVSQAIQDEERP